jgi:sporulation protein YqfC
MDIVKPRLEITGSNECVVDGLMGIVEYSNEKIKVNLGKYFVTFYGDGLFINSFSHEGAVVEGSINSLEFERYD